MIVVYIYQYMLYICISNKAKQKPHVMKTKTYKAGFTQCRAEVMNRLGLKFEVIEDTIIYKGQLDKTFVSFLIDKKIELGIR